MTSRIVKSASRQVGGYDYGNSRVENLQVNKLLSWVPEFLLALSLIYSLLFLARYFGASFFVLLHRGMVEYVVSGIFLSANLDPAVWCFSVLGVLAWLFYSLYLNNVRGFRRIALVFVQCALGCLGFFGFLGFLPLVCASLLLVVLCFAFSGSYFWLSRFSLLKRLVLGFVLVALFVEIADLVLFNVPLILNSNILFEGAHWNLVELSFSNLAYSFLPFAYLFFIALGIFAFSAKALLAGKVGEQFVGFVRRLKSVFKFEAYEPLFGRFPLVLAVLISVAVSVLFVVFTVLPWFNQTNMLVSVDSPQYYQWLIHMRSINVNSALSFAIGNDRAVFLVLIYALSFVVAPVNVLQLVAALLIALFSIVSLLVLRLFSRFRDAWVLGVMLVPFSFQALGLIYSGYFANILAMILVFAYFVVFFKAISSWSSFWVFVLLAISEMILFTHSWTWFIFALSLGMFLFLEWRLALREKRLWGRLKVKVSFVGATIIVGLVSDFAKEMLLLGSSTGSVLQTAQTSLSYPNFGFLFGGLRQTVSFDLGGVFANQLLVFLTIVGFLFLLSFKSEISNLFVSWIFVASVAMTFASADFVFDRFLFLMPSVILGGFGLAFIVRFACSFNGSKALKHVIEVLIVALVFLVFLNSALSYLLNLNIL